MAQLSSKVLKVLQLAKYILRKLSPLQDRSEEIRGSARQSSSKQVRQIIFSDVLKLREGRAALPWHKLDCGMRFYMPNEVLRAALAGGDSSGNLGNRGNVVLDYGFPPGVSRSLQDFSN